MGDDRGPELLGFLPVVVDVLRRVAAAEGVDEADAHLPCRGDHFLQVGDDRVAVLDVGVEGIGIVAEGRDLDAALGEGKDDLLAFGLAETGDVDMAGAGIAAGAAGGDRPAGDLQRREALRARPVGDFEERRRGERRGQES